MYSKLTLLLRHWGSDVPHGHVRNKERDGRTERERKRDGEIARLFYVTVLMSLYRSVNTHRTHHPFKHFLYSTDSVTHQHTQAHSVKA